MQKPIDLAAARAPLYEALERHANRNGKPFHVPGHKQRAAWNDEGANARFASILPIDLTELSDTDDLHHPEGVIAEAQALAADCFGAEETCFLVGGSTAGNLAMILAVCQPGDLVLAQRNSHKSIIHGLMLAGARAVFLQPEPEEASGLAVTPSAQTIVRAMERHPEAKALLLTNPNYYGLSVDLSAIAALAHERGLPVLVDEAHGPHFGRHAAFPGGALQAGADIVVQSAHKMLSSLTMGAMLHMQGGLVDREAVRQMLHMVQSSSPSYPLMASLDLARRELHVRRERMFELAVRTAECVRDKLADAPIRPVRPIEPVRLDPLKLTLYDTSGRLSGYRLRDELESRGCVPEMADDRFAVLALGAGTVPEDGEALVRALRDIAATFRLDRLPEAPDGEPARRAAAAAAEAFPYRELSEPVAFDRSRAATEKLPLDRAAGRTAGEWVIPYPPGIPLLYPGEPITPDVVSALRKLRQSGAKFQGAEDSALESIRVRLQE